MHEWYDDRYDDGSVGQRLIVIVRLHAHAAIAAASVMDPLDDSNATVETASDC